MKLRGVNDSKKHACHVVTEFYQMMVYHAAMDLIALSLSLSLCLCLSLSISSVSVFALSLSGSAETCVE